MLLAGLARTPGRDVPRCAGAVSSRPPLLTPTALIVLAWIYVLAGHGGFWRTGHRLPASGRQPDSWPSVIVVIPARDEADMLPQTLPTLLTQDYPGRFTVILVDDESTDGTAEVAAGLDNDSRLKVISGSPTPPGWAGKVWAMQQGLDAAIGADYILFTDADIGYAPGTLTRLVEAAGDQYALVSQMALLRCESRGRAPADPGVRLLLRPALPVPPGQPPHEQESGRSRRVHAGPARRPRRGRRP